MNIIAATVITNNMESNFVCYDKVLDSDSQVIVKQGDIIGACVTDGSSDNQEPLNIIGSVSNGSEESLLVTQTNRCNGMNQMPTTIQAHLLTEFSTLDSMRLHLYANIGLFPLKN